MSTVFGIDLGTTYSCIAYMDSNHKPVVIKNAEGSLTTPSVVYFESENSVTVGESAKENAKLFPTQVVSFIKRNIGIENYRQIINDREMRPEEISAYILKKLVKDAIDTLRDQGIDVDENSIDAVITCPAYFGMAERKATEAAGKIAGLNVLSIINEPTAAAISYGMHENAESKRVLIYDLGGGTFDITLMEINRDTIKVICTGGDKNLGGKDWDDRILEYLDNEYQNETGTHESILDDDEALQDLFVRVEKGKKNLSSKDRTPIPVSYKGISKRIDLTRDKFNELTSELLERTIALTENIIAEARQKEAERYTDIDEILLVGGSTRMPQVMERLKLKFQCPIKLYDPDEAVAKGAAIYASNMSSLNKLVNMYAAEEGQSPEKIQQKLNDGTLSVNAVKSRFGIGEEGSESFLNADRKIINVCSRTYGTEVVGEIGAIIYNMIFKNSELPAKYEDDFCPVNDNQKNVSITVFESFSTKREDDLSIGKEIGNAVLTLPKGATRRTQISIRFTLEESGLLTVYAKELMGGNEIEAVFQTVDGISQKECDEAKQRMSLAEVN